MKSLLHIGSRAVPFFSGVWVLVSAGLAFAVGAADPVKIDLWSLTPLVRPAVPAVAARSPIDAFINARLAAEGLRPAPEADRRTLVRRVWFDLVGLPPRPEDVEAFVADKDPRAYERLVERLLESPQYGERWARHWLDVVHFGETHGYDKDQPRPNAWPYRDYVVRAFNQDRPYARFIQEQVAGDVLFAGTRDGIEALGFIAAGPWDLIGHAEVPESKIDGQVARHLDRDDMVATTLQTFNSLTVQCAQCHNHKFDPITQEDYYSLQAVFAAVDRTDRKYDPDPEVGRRRAVLEDRRRTLDQRRQVITGHIVDRAGTALKDVERDLAAAEKAAKDGEAFGYHSLIEARADTVKWVQIDLGRPVPLARVVLHPCRDDFNGIGEGFGFPVRYRVEVSDDVGFVSGVGVIADRTEADVPNPRLQAQVIDGAGRTAQFVRVTATRLAPRMNDHILALAELEVFDTHGTNVARGAAVTALDSTEAPLRWQKRNLTDGWYPGISVGEVGGVAELRRRRDGILTASTLPDEMMARDESDRGVAEVAERLAKLPPQSVAYIGAVHSGSGAFAGTGSRGGRPRTIHILDRGSVQKPGREVGPGSVQSVGILPARFELGSDAPEGERRAALARWLSDADNPLTWRSIVNRVWQYHFGRGLVETPNDFGHMGGRPSHPELLDWLAVEFRDGGQSFKRLHRQILLSAAYRRTAAGDPAAERVDADNRWLWRQNRRKLEAEAVRDAVLCVAGRLDGQMGGPSFRDFVIDKPEHSPHYEYHLHDPEDPRSHRRSIYRFIVRSQQQPFMTSLDCADPSMQVGRRNESVSPLQALTLLNNALMLSMSRHWAERLESVPGGLDGQIEHAGREALGRSFTGAERAALVDYARAFGLPNTCRVIFNLNEFTFVD